MPRALTVASVVETHQVASAVAFLILIEIDVVNQADVLIETIRVVNNNENITFGGNEYVAANFKLDTKTKAGEEPGVSLSAFDPTGILRQRLEEFDGGIGFEVRMIILNSDRLNDPPEATETFEIIGANAQGYSIKLNLGMENPLRMAFPVATQEKDRCRHKYKGTRCAYAGALGTCDFTYDGANGCVAHGNEDNFGGFRGLKTLNV